MCGNWWLPPRSFPRSIGASHPLRMRHLVKSNDTLAAGPQGVEALHSTAPFVAQGATSEQDRPTSCHSPSPFPAPRTHPSAPNPTLFPASCRHALSSFYIHNCRFFFLARFKPAAAVSALKKNVYHSVSRSKYKHTIFFEKWVRLQCLS